MRRRNRFPALGDVQQIMAGRYHQREAARATETDIMPSSSKRPDDPNELAREGAACWQAREFDKAISHYTAALQLAPNCTALLSRRADAHAHKGDFKRAIADIDSALHIDRCDSSLYVQKLNLLAYNAELTGAVLDVSVLSGNLDSAGAHLFLAIQLFYEKSVQESMSSCNDAVRLDRTFAAGYAWRGYVYAVLGEKGPAERDWAEAIRLGSPPSGHGFLSALPYFGLAHYLYSDGRYLEAVIYSDHAIRLYSTFLPAYYQRGLALLALDNHTGAINDFSAVLSLRPTDQRALIARSKCYEGVGNFAKAELDRKTAAIFIRVSAGQNKPGPDCTDFIP